MSVFFIVGNVSTMNEYYYTPNI